MQRDAERFERSQQTRQQDAQQHYREDEKKKDSNTSEAVKQEGTVKREIQEPWHVQEGLGHVKKEC